MKFTSAIALLLATASAKCLKCQDLVQLNRRHPWNAALENTSHPVEYPADSPVGYEAVVDEAPSQTQQQRNPDASLVSIGERLAQISHNLKSNDYLQLERFPEVIDTK